MCVVCRNKFPKEKLVKIVKNADGIKFDKECKVNGRGLYICRAEKCIKDAIKRRAVNKAFRCVCPDEIYKELENFDEFNEV